MASPRLRRLQHRKSWQLFAKLVRARSPVLSATGCRRTRNCNAEEQREKKLSRGDHNADSMMRWGRNTMRCWCHWFRPSFDLGKVTTQHSHHFSRISVPEPDCSVAGSSGDLSTVCREHDSSIPPEWPPGVHCSEVPSGITGGRCDRNQKDPGICCCFLSSLRNSITAYIFGSFCFHGGGSDHRCSVWYILPSRFRTVDHQPVFHTDIETTWSDDGR